MKFNTIEKKDVSFKTDIQIDTMLFYHWAELENNSNYSADSIGKVLQKYKRVWISEVTLFEFLNRFQNDEKKINHGLKFVLQKELVIDKLQPPYTIIDRIFDRFDTEYLDKIIETKKHFEAQYLRFFLVFANLVLGKYLISIHELTLPQQNDFTQHIQSLFEGNESFLYDKAKKMIDDFYKDEKNYPLKDKIESLVLTTYYALSVNLFMTTNDAVENVVEKMNADSFVNKIRKRLNRNFKEENSPKFIAQEKDRIIFEKILKEYVESSVLNGFFPRGQLVYFLGLINKIFLDKKKVHKNDFLDAVIFSHYHQMQFITIDGKFLNTIKMYDESYHNKIVEITAYMKKKD